MSNHENPAQTIQNSFMIVETNIYLFFTGTAVLQTEAASFLKIKFVKFLEFHWNKVNSDNQQLTNNISLWTGPHTRPQSGVSGKGFLPPGNGKGNWKSHYRFTGREQDLENATGREGNGKFEARNPGNSRESYNKQG